MDPWPLALAFPAVAALVALGWRPWRSGAAPRSGPAAGAVSIPIAYVLVWYGWNDAWPDLLPAELTSGKNWILPGLAAGALGGLLPRSLAWQVFLAWVAAEVIVGAGHALSFAQVEGPLLPLELCLKVLVVYAGVSFACASKRQGCEVPVLGLTWLVGVALAVLNGGWAQGALLLASTGFLAGGCALVGLWRRDWAPLEGAALGVGLAGAGVLLVGYRLSETPLEATLCAAAIPALALGAGRGGVWAAAMRIALAAGLAYGAYHLSIPADNPYASYS